MSLKNRVFLGIYVFLLVFVFSIPGFSANKEAFVSISPIAKEYLPGQVVTLAVQPGTYYEELNQHISGASRHLEVLSFRV